MKVGRSSSSSVVASLLSVPPPPRLLFLAIFIVCTTTSLTANTTTTTTTTINPSTTTLLSLEPPQHVIAQFPKNDRQQQSTYADYNGTTTREAGFRFNHLVLDQRTGQLFGGAVNRLVQLDADLKLIELASTGKKKIIFLLFLIYFFGA